MNLTVEAQRFLCQSRKGILSTHSVKHEGYPFGSVTPFVLDQQGMPTILISTIAEHTKNIIQDGHVSLIVFDNADDLQANARLTLLATAEQTDKQNTLLRDRYLRYTPHAVGYFEAHDFHFYTLHITHARYIAGFGKMGWIEGESMQLPSNPLFIEEPGIIEHMNADHTENLKAYCLQFHQIATDEAEMVGIDSLGFDVRIAPEQLLRFEFGSTVNNAQEARAALVAMAKQCRH